MTHLEMFLIGLVIIEEIYGAYQLKKRKTLEDKLDDMRYNLSRVLSKATGGKTMGSTVYTLDSMLYMIDRNIDDIVDCSFDARVESANRVIEKAKALRAAQRAYLDDRGNEALGKKVGEAAVVLDEEVARYEGLP